jgi:hypothetical protein
MSKVIKLFSNNIYDFAQANKLSLVCRWNADTLTWEAAFDRCLLKTPDTGAYLSGKIGLGKTAHEAISEYWNIINGNTLVLEPFGGSKRRKEIPVI